MATQQTRYFRHPQTTQERRKNAAHPSFVRSKRRHLPNSWDDIYRSRDYVKSWKLRSKLKRQWMVWPTCSDVNFIWSWCH